MTQGAGAGGGTSLLRVLRPFPVLGAEEPKPWAHFISTRAVSRALCGTDGNLRPERLLPAFLRSALHHACARARARARTHTHTHTHAGLVAITSPSQARLPSVGCSGRSSAPVLRHQGARSPSAILGGGSQLPVLVLGTSGFTGVSFRPRARLMAASFFFHTLWTGTEMPY